MNKEKIRLAISLRSSLARPIFPVIKALAVQGYAVKITFKGPTFFDSTDEDKFFEWIYSLPNYVKITGKGMELELALNEPMNQSTIDQIFIIFKRWDLDFNSLTCFKADYVEWLETFRS